MDTAARRVLPGHLLRRARVLSSLPLGGSCLLRVSLTACTGEALVLLWRLALTGLPGIASSGISGSSDGGSSDGGSNDGGSSDGSSNDGGSSDGGSSSPCTHGSRGSIAANTSSSSSSSSSGGEGSSSATAGAAATQGSCWRVVSITRDSSGDEQPALLPPRPHPRVSPETVVLTQLHALRQGQLLAASGWNMMGHHASSSGWEPQLAAFKRLAASQPYAVLCSSEGARVQLGPSALPSQRQLLQEVVVVGPPQPQPQPPPPPQQQQQQQRGCGSGGGYMGGGVASEARFLWRLGIQDRGCWMVRSIEAL
jgi:hypothetical protein